MAMILSKLSRLNIPKLDRIYFEAFLKTLPVGCSVPGLVTDKTLVGVSLDKEFKLYLWVKHAKDGTIVGCHAPTGWEDLPEGFNPDRQTFKTDEELLCYARGLRFAFDRESEEEHPEYAENTAS